MKRTRLFLAALVIATTAYFFYRNLAANWKNIQDISLTPNLLVLIGLLFLIISVISSGLLWSQIVRTLSGKVISKGEAVRVHLASWLLKYIPGQAGSYLNKLSWGSSRGYGKKLITSSFIYENVFLIFASTLPTLPVVAWLFLEDLNDNISVFIPLLFLIPAAIMMNTKVFYGIASWFSQKTRRQTLSRDLFLEGRQLWLLQLKFFLPRILNGAGFVFIAASLFGITAGMFIPLAAIYVLAGIVGVLAVFVPSGLGVREAVIVLLTSSYFTTEESIALALIARFYATIADVGILGIYLALNGWKFKQT